jgi:hypothetical protein
MGKLRKERLHTVCMWNGSWLHKIRPEEVKEWSLRPLRAKARARSLLCFHVSSFPSQEGERLLCHSAWTFGQTHVSLRGYRRSEAEAASHLRVGYGARMLPAGRAPDLPSTPGTGHTRDADLLTSRWAESQRGVQVTLDGSDARRGTGASAATTVSERTGRSRDKTARVWWYVWRRAPCGAARTRRRSRLKSAMNIPGARSPTLRPNCCGLAR